MIVIGVANNWDIFVDYIGVVLLAVFLHDALALLLGYSIARATRLPERSTKAMTFEVGIRNAGLGLLLVFTYFDGLGGMALVAAWWGIWDIIAGLARRPVVGLAGRVPEPEPSRDGRPGHRRQRVPRLVRRARPRGRRAVGGRRPTCALRDVPVPGVEHVVMDVTSAPAVVAAFASATGRTSSCTSPRS